jgi:hypothetical protein
MKQQSIRPLIGMYNVKMHLSNYNIQWAMVRGKHAVLTEGEVEVFMGFEGTHGYGYSSSSSSYVFGQLEHLYILNYSNIATIVKVEVIAIPRKFH